MNSISGTNIYARLRTPRTVAFQDIEFVMYRIKLGKNIHRDHQEELATLLNRELIFKIFINLGDTENVIYIQLQPFVTVAHIVDTSVLKMKTEESDCKEVEISMNSYLHEYRFI